MATKKKRPSRQSASSGTPRSYSELYKGQSVLPDVTAEGSQAAEAVVADKKVNWAQEYAYVYRDLRYLGVVSGVLLITLLVIGFFI